MADRKDGLASQLDNFICKRALKKMREATASDQMGGG